MSAAGHETRIAVRYAETDQMGVVHHANYLVWFELARTELCAASGFHYAEIEKMGAHLMVTGVGVRYRRSARYGGDVTVRCHIDRLQSRAIRFAYEVRQDDVLLAEGTTDHLWVDAASGRPGLPPPEVKAAFEALAAAD